MSKGKGGAPGQALDQGPDQSLVQPLGHTDLVEGLADIAKRMDLSEIEYQVGDLRIRVARQMAQAMVVAAVPEARSAAVVAPVGSVEVEHPGTVKSPMVGTAYLRPAPESPPFVEVGSQVRTGDTILLVEAMKTFNEIIAPKGGTVRELLVGDGEPVEYGQALFVLE